MAEQIREKLGALQNDIDDAIQHQAITGGKKPNITFAGKRDQVQEWLQNPAGDPSGLGRLLAFFLEARVNSGKLADLMRRKASFVLKSLLGSLRC